MKSKTMSAAKAKAEFLALLDEVARTRQEIVVTKRGKAIARLVPLKRGRKPVATRGRIVGDVVSPIDTGWEIG